MNVSEVSGGHYGELIEIAGNMLDRHDLVDSSAPTLVQVWQNHQKSNWTGFYEIESNTCFSFLPILHGTFGCRKLFAKSNLTYSGIGYRSRFDCFITQNDFGYRLRVSASIGCQRQAA